MVLSHGEAVCILTVTIGLIVMVELAWKSFLEDTWGVTPKGEDS